MSPCSGIRRPTGHLRLQSSTYQKASTVVLYRYALFRKEHLQNMEFFLEKGMGGAQVDYIFIAIKVWPQCHLKFILRRVMMGR